jgi:hypothetical protein
MATTTASDKQVAKIREWLKTQSPETQTRLGDMLEKGLVKEVKAELPAGWASKQAPTQSVPKAEASTGTTAPKAKGAKLKSVATNPAAKAAKEAISAEASAASTAGTVAEESAKGAGALAKAKGLGGKLGRYAAGANVVGNLYGRGKEFYDDISTGKTVGEALNKPESNKALGQSLVDSALIAGGERVGAAVGSRFGMPIPGALVGGLAAPVLGRVGSRTLDVALNGPKDYTKPTAAKASAAPEVKTPTIGFNEASDWLKANNMDATEGNFQKAFQELSKRQQEQINKTPEPKPSADTFKPSAKESVAMAEQAVKAPIGMQDKAPEPDIMSFLNNPDTQGMIAELAAKQANRVQSASNIPDFKPRKKNEDDEDGMSPSSTTTANVRPPPRFFVNTGRFGTMAGGGSRRSPSGRLL